MKKILGILIIVVGAFITYGMFSIGETGDLHCHRMIPFVGGALLACAVVTALLFWILENRILQVVLSFFASYTAYITIVLVGSWITGDLAETMMWFPLMLFFGIPSTFPLTAGTITGIALFTARKTNKAEPAH